MTNHVHLLVSSESATGVAKLMQSVGGGYVRSFNARHGRTGTLWDGRYFSSPVGSDAYFWNCHRYIELNPVRAGIVEAPGEYMWSSYASNAHGNHDPVVTPHPQYLALAVTRADVAARYRDFFAIELEHAVVRQIRETLGNERAFGSEEFLDAIEATSCRSPRHRGRGRPKAIPANSQS